MTTTIGKWIIFAGVVFIIVGLIIYIFGKLGVPLGKLPGDISFKKKNTSVFFPIGTSILLSIVLTVIINVIIRLIRK